MIWGSRDGHATFADVPPGVLDGGVAVDVGQQAEAEAVAVVGGVGEAVHQHAGGGRLEGLAHAVVELVVDDGAPVLGLLVGHGLDVCTGRAEGGGERGGRRRWRTNTHTHTCTP